MTGGLTPLSIDVYEGYSPDYVIIDLDRKIEKQQLLFKMSVLFVLVNENQENYYKCLSLSNFKSAMISSEIDARSASTRSHYYRETSQF